MLIHDTKSPTTFGRGRRSEDLLNYVNALCAVILAIESATPNFCAKDMAPRAATNVGTVGV